MLLQPAEHRDPPSRQHARVRAIVKLFELRLILDTFIYLFIMTALSVRQLVKYTLLLPQPIATVGIRNRVFSHLYEFFLAEKKLAMFQLSF